MIPTDAMINRACAEACGWKEITEGVLETHWIPPYNQHIAYDAEYFYSTCRYCQDRNALPELWNALEKAGANACMEYARLLPCYDESGDEVLTVWRAVQIEPRLHCIAALQALDKWPADWEVGE